MSHTLPPEIMFDFETIELHMRLHSREAVDKLIENLRKLQALMPEQSETSARSAAEPPIRGEGVNHDD